MKDISFHITDITQNSIRARASEIKICLITTNNSLTLKIKDNGVGMSEENLKMVHNPFYTTRKSRKVGLGVPFLIQNTEQTGGNVVIKSILNGGTEFCAKFITSHIDMPPIGNLSETLAHLITGNPTINIILKIQKNGSCFEISSNEIIPLLNGIPLSHTKVSILINNLIDKNI